MQQVHGDRVVRVDHNDDGKTIKNCDALVSDDPEVTLSVRVADCLPISISDKKNHSFGLVHAGWRGLQKRIIAKTIKLMVRGFISNPEDIEVTIGSHICQKHYEVRSDVSKGFEMYPGTILRKGKKEFVDLAKVAEIQLIESGVKKEKIKIDKTCTFEDLSLPSFRRDKTPKRLNIGLSLT